jgi:acyl carrier protein
MMAYELIADRLVELIAEATGTQEHEIPWDVPFIELGLCSVQAVELSEDIGRWLDRELTPTLVFDYPTIEEAALHLEQLRRGQADVEVAR